MKFFQLTLRDLFWLILLVAMGCAWWVNHKIGQNERDSLRREMIELLAKIRHSRF